MLRRSAMYNLKVSTAAAACGGGGCPGACPGAEIGSAGLLGVDPQGLTPRTPEILNSLIAMSNPMDAYQEGACGAAIPSSGSCAPDLNSPTGAVSDCSSCSGSVTSPPSVTSPQSVQHMRSQLIKEGLKLTLQTKRRHCSGENTNTDDDDDNNTVVSGKRSKKEELTAEDEERRRRRRERNKVAATKCRIKKRERTVNLVQESEILESQNYELKSQIQELETQRRRLVDMLSTHTPTCTRPALARSSPDDNAYAPYDAPYDAYPPPSEPAPPYDLLTSPYHPLDSYCTDPSPPQLTPLDQPYYPVTKHEVPEDPLLSGFDDDLNTLGDAPFSCPPPLHHQAHPLPHSHPHMPHIQQQTYCRPASMGLDTPASSSSLDRAGAGGACQNYQHPQDGVFGLDSGCMA